jgi:hypothetical protein
MCGGIFVMCVETNRWVMDFDHGNLELLLRKLSYESSLQKTN